MYTYIFDLAQLERCQDLYAQGIIRIIHVLCEDGPGWDQYVTLVDCSPQQALLLHLI